MINNTEMRKTILKVYGLISLLLIADIAAYYFYKISLRGYYSDIILFWLWFFGSFAIIILFWKKIMAKLLLGAIVLALVLSILPMAMPFFALVFSTTSYGLWVNRNLNENYRAQIVGYSVMTYPVLQVIEKKSIIEKQVFQCGDRQLLDDHPNIKIRYAKDIIFQHETPHTLSLILVFGSMNKLLTFDKISGKIIENGNTP